MHLRTTVLRGHSTIRVRTLETVRLQWHCKHGHKRCDPASYSRIARQYFGHVQKKYIYWHFINIARCNATLVIWTLPWFHLNVPMFVVTTVHIAVYLACCLFWTDWQLENCTQSTVEKNPSFLLSLFFPLCPSNVDSTAICQALLYSDPPLFRNKGCRNIEPFIELRKDQFTTYCLLNSIRNILSRISKHMVQ